MNYSLRMALMAGSLSTAVVYASGKAGHIPAPERVLAIHLYDQAQVPAAILHSAIGEVTRIFRATGIQLMWQQPPADSPEAWLTDMSAYFGAPPERHHLVVRLVRRTPVTIAPGALGFALPMAPTGVQASVFYDRVEALHSRMNADLSVMLGYAIAHEIGHVLLGSSQHSKGGLMQANWNPATWRLASAGLLNFCPSETKQMSSTVAKYHSATQDRSFAVAAR